MSEISSPMVESVSVARSSQPQPPLSLTSANAPTPHIGSLMPDLSHVAKRTAFLIRIELRECPGWKGKATVDHDAHLRVVPQVRFKLKTPKPPNRKPRIAQTTHGSPLINLKTANDKKTMPMTGTPFLIAFGISFPPF
jgi:hypothetical protein